MTKKINKIVFKKYYTASVLALCLSITQEMKAQIKQTPPVGIIFQAIATDPQGNPAAGRTIYVQDAILQKTATGTVVYIETFQVKASATGVFTIVIGKGKVSYGPQSIASIDWSAGPYFLNIESAIAPVGSTAGWIPVFIDMGTSQFWSVPYALHAGSITGLNFPSSSGTNGQVLSTNGSGTLSWVTPLVQVNSDWNATSGSAQILNKPTLATVATSGSYTDLVNKPALSTVATSGSYTDLSNKPIAYSLPTASTTTLGV
jgi:hypothetical protein